MIYRFSRFTLDDRAYEIRQGDLRISVERRVFDVIYYLMRNYGRVVPKAELFRTVWAGKTVTDASLSIVISAARKALGDDATRQDIIATLHGRGYRFAAQVVAEEGPNEEFSATLSVDEFVGREQELEQLQVALGASRRGRLQLVLLSGEPGIGKSRLIDQFARAVVDSGNVAIIARCPEQEGAPPFWPWVQTLREYIDGIAPYDLPSFLARLDDLAQLVPDASPQLTPGPAIRDAAQARFRLFDAFATFLDRAAKRTPLVILLDDVHRADEASLLLLSYLSKAIADTPLLVVAAYRDTQHSPALARMVCTLLRSSSVRQMHLHGLQREPASRLVRGIAGRELGPPLLSMLYEKSAGNPFFLTQLAKHVADLPRVDDPLSLPADLAGAVARQIADLPLDVQRLLALAAVAGSTFSLPVLSRAADMPLEQVIELLQIAVDAGIIQLVSRSSEVYRFTHSLLRDALYQLHSAPARRLQHHSVARALVACHWPEIEPHLAAIAHHYDQGSLAGAKMEAIEFHTRAGDAAAKGLAYEDASAHYGRALHLVDSERSVEEALRRQLLARYGAQLTKSGDRVRAKATFDRLARLAARDSAPLDIAEAALGLAPGVLALEFGVVDSFQIELIESALRSVGQALPQVRAKLLARLVTALHWSDRRSEARAHLDECGYLASKIVEPEVQAQYLQAKWLFNRDPNAGLERLQIAESLAATRSPALEPEFNLVSQLALLTSLLEMGDVDRFSHQLSNFLGLADGLRQPQAAWYTSMLAGMTHLLAGRFREAEAEILRFTTLGGRVGDANSQHSAIAHSLVCRCARGEFAELLPEARAVCDRYPALVGWRAVVPWLLANLGRTQDAARELARFCPLSFGEIPERLDWPAAAVLVAETVAKIGDGARAQSLYDVLLPMQDQYAIVGLSVVNWGSYSRHLGLLAGSLGKWKLARKHLEQALVMNRRIGAEAWVAHTEFELARAIARSGEPTTSSVVTGLLSSAEQAALRMGMSALAREAKRQLGALRQTRRSRASGRCL